ncbi:hypothetical protein TNCT_501011 [Trichonephila clavata]|uniref:Uncharacterized protein n=1 Tax=Trichonephila clavata TaxID=2740835 RepID=A0A8X6F1C0_TRICU|nr:hypothetical protein TNCT_501011 [Trichonephila clavata]
MNLEIFIDQNYIYGKNMETLLHLLIYHLNMNWMPFQSLFQYLYLSNSKDGVSEDKKERKFTTQEDAKCLGSSQRMVLQLL